MRWDIFCRVIDNYGDIGVCWRLACALADQAQDVRLWADDLGPLQWMAPSGHPGVQALPWPPHPGVVPGDVVVEAFGCEIPPAFATAMGEQGATGRQAVWINLEYLSAERFVERNHLLPSPVLQGPAAGLQKVFFYPGFTPGTGGLLRERGLVERQKTFHRAAWLATQGIDFQGELVVALFCYEPAALANLLQQLAAAPEPVRLLVTAGRASAAVQQYFSSKTACWPAPNGHSLLSISYLPPLPQTDFDHLLWAADVNFVRGEDSLVRALWAGKACIWHLYPQDDGAHHAKLDAWLDLLQAPPTLRQFHHRWNGLAAAPLPALEPLAWRGCVQRLREQVLAQDDLASQLLRFARKNR